MQITVFKVSRSYRENLAKVFAFDCTRHIQSLRLRANSSVNLSKTTATMKPMVEKGVTGIVIVIVIVIIISMQVYLWLLCYNMFNAWVLEIFFGYNWKRCMLQLLFFLVSHPHKLSCLSRMRMLGANKSGCACACIFISHSHSDVGWRCVKRCVQFSHMRKASFCSKKHSAAEENERQKQRHYDWDEKKSPHCKSSISTRS